MKWLKKKHTENRMYYSSIRLCFIFVSLFSDWPRLKQTYTQCIPRCACTDRQKHECECVSVSMFPLLLFWGVGSITSTSRKNNKKNIYSYILKIKNPHHWCVWKSCFHAYRWFVGPFKSPPSPQILFSLLQKLFFVWFILLELNSFANFTISNSLQHGVLFCFFTWALDHKKS